MDEELDVIVIGFDVSERQAEAGLMRVFGLDASRARRFVRELPIVAKRCSNRASADRYVRALRSIGASVKVQPASGDPGGPGRAAQSGTSSLPIPAPSMLARVDESARVERETVRAIKRFRAAEGLDPAESPPFELDPANPSIPRAPLVPHDLEKMPNAKLPQLSERPDREDAQGSAARERRPLSVRPSAVGLAHAATASVRPGLGMLSWWQLHQPATRRRRPLSDYWPIAAVLVIVLGVLGLSGAFETDAHRREQAWRMQGIEPGENAPAATWLEPTEHELDGVDKQAARALLERLHRSGARSVYAVGIQSAGRAKRARSLVIELPDLAAERRNVLWQIARARDPRPVEPDHGRRYYVLTFD